MESRSKLSAGIVGGILIAGLGMIIRGNARQIAWPKEYGFMGSRGSTEWFFQEELFKDYGRALILLGCGFFLATFYRWLCLSTTKQA